MKYYMEAMKVKAILPKAEEMTDMLEQGYVHFRHMEENLTSDSQADMVYENMDNLYSGYRRSHELETALKELADKLEEVDELCEYIARDFPGFWKKLNK